MKAIHVTSEMQAAGVKVLEDSGLLENGEFHQRADGLIIREVYLAIDKGKLETMPISPGGTKYDNEELDALFKAVGFVVVQWGQAEQSLEMIVAMLFQNLGGKPLTNRIPVLLSPKLKFVRKCFTSIPSLQQFKPEGEALIQKFEELSQRRHDLIHGAIAGLSLDNGGFPFVKLDVKDGFHVAREFRFESAEFPKLKMDLVDLGAAATALGRKLWERVEKPHATAPGLQL